MIEHNVDYIQCSRFLNEQYCRERDMKPIHGFGFYKRGYEDKLGVRYYYGNNRTEKTFVVYSGRALHNHRVVGYDNIETINMLLSVYAKISRLDLCITEFVEDNLVRVDDIEKWYHDDKIESSWCKDGAKKFVSLEDDYQQHTETLYIGDLQKRGKRGIFRAYDKGVELDLGKFMITRLEIEDRGDKAHTSAKRLAMSKNIGSVFKTRFDVDDPEFKRICDSPDIDTSRGQQLDNGDEMEQLDKRWTWLLNQVAPSLRKSIEADRTHGLGDDRLIEFLNRVTINWKEVK